MGSTRRRSLSAVATAVAAFLLSTACGGQSAAPAAPPPPLDTAALTAKPTAYPLTIDNCGRKITFDKAPSRVLLLNGASVGEVESFVTLGIQDRILANSQSYGVSEQPDMVDKIKVLPTAGLELNENYAVPREQVLALKPDLVVSTSAHGFDEKTGAATRDQLDSQGIKSLTTPVNCAFGEPKPRPEDTARHRAQSVESSFELLMTLGEIFDVQQRAVDHITKARADITAVRKRVDGKPRKNVLVTFPGMSMMNNNGLPAIFGGGIFDDVIARAGGVNPFGGRDEAKLAEINAEALATAQVDVLVIGVYQASENPDAMAAELFAKFPNWQASKTRTYTSVSDGIYLGPLNSLAIAKIADVAHRDR